MRASHKQTPKPVPLPRVPATPEQLRWRRRVRFAVLMGCLLGLAAVGYWSVYPLWRVAHELELAERSLQQHDLVAAKSHLKRLLDTDKNHAKGTFLLAQTHRRLEEYELAGPLLEEARRLEWVAESIELEQRLTRAQKEGPREDEATLLLYVKGRHPEDKLILEALILGYLNTHSLGQALVCAEIWLERYPDEWFPHHRRGEIREATLDFEGAIADYTQVLTLKPEYSPAQRQLGLVYLKGKQDFSEARKYLEPYCARFPDDFDAQVGYARCLQGLGDKNAALVKLDQLLTQQPQHVPALIFRAELADDHPSEALAYLRRAEHEEPMDRLVVYQLSVVLGQLERRQEAEEYRKKHVQIDKDINEFAAATAAVWKEPHSPELRTTVAKILLRLGRDDLAVRWLHSALAENAQYAPAHQVLYEHYRQSNSAQQLALAEHHRRLSVAKSEKNPPYSGKGTP